MKKTFLLFGATMLPLLASADNHFVNGTEWINQIHGLGPDLPYPITFESQIKIDGDTIVDGVNALKVYEQSVWYDEPNLCAIIKVEGEKVYTLNDYTSNEWYLAYDFSLKAGEGCWVGNFNAFEKHWDRPNLYYLKCVGIEPNDEYGGWPSMHMEAYTTSECKEEGYRGECHWLIGIGSAYGVDYNFKTDMLEGGGGEFLISIERDGEIICQRTTDSLNDAVAPSALSVSVDGLGAAIAGAEPGCEVNAYSADGSLAASAKADDNGRATLVLPHKGLFLIAADSTSAKVLVR